MPALHHHVRHAPSQITQEIHYSARSLAGKGRGRRGAVHAQNQETLMVETTGKTRAEAVARALEKLGIREQEASVTVLEERRARFLGLFGGPEVRVRVARRTERGGDSHS